MSLKGDGPTVESLTEELNTAKGSLEAANKEIETLKASSADWKKGIDANPESNPTLTKYATVKDLFQAHLSLQQKLGDQANLIRPPKGPDDKEGWAALSKALGVPAKPEDYKFSEVKRPDNFPTDEKQVAQFRQLAHKYNLTPAQADGLYKEVVEANVKLFNEMQGTQAQTAKQLESEMATEFGAAWPEKKENAQKVIDKYAPNDKALGDKILNDPAAIRLLVKIGEKFSEDGLIEGSGGTGRLSPKEARAEINKILADQNDLYHKDNSIPGAKERKDYVNTLYEMEAAGNKE